MESETGLHNQGEVYSASISAMRWDQVFHTFSHQCNLDRSVYIHLDSSWFVLYALY